MERVPGLSSAHKLALLNLAATFLSEGEAYLEVGSWKGQSIIAAMLENPGGRFYAVESFRGFGVARDATRAELIDNLTRWGLRARLHLWEGNAFNILRGQPFAAEPVGVYFYDANHSALGHYLALGLAEPHLADEALAIIDDTASRVVAKATDRYVSRHPGYHLLLELPAGAGERIWWNGIRVYRFERRRAHARANGKRWDLGWRLMLFRLLHEPAIFVFGRLVPRAGPKLVAAMKGKGSQGRRGTVRLLVGVATLVGGGELRQRGALAPTTRKQRKGSHASARTRLRNHLGGWVALTCGVGLWVGAAIEAVQSAHLHVHGNHEARAGTALVAAAVSFAIGVLIMRIAAALHEPDRLVPPL